MLNNRKRNRRGNRRQNNKSIAKSRIGTMVVAPGIQGADQLTLPRAQKSPVIRVTSREQITIVTTAAGAFAFNVPLYRPNIVYAGSGTTAIAQQSDFDTYGTLFKYYKLNKVTLLYYPTIAPTTSIPMVSFGMTLDSYNAVTYTSNQVNNFASASSFDPRKPASFTFRIPVYADFESENVGESVLQGGWLGWIDPGTTAYVNGCIAFSLSGAPISTTIGTLVVQYEGKWKDKR